MRVTIDKIESYEPERIRAFLESTLRPAIEQLPNAKRILVKPNLLGAFEPGKAVTTHPAVVEETVRLLQEMGRDVLLGDSPGGSAPLSHVLEVTGMRGVAERTGVEIVDFKQAGMREVTRNGVQLWITKAFDDSDAVVNLCKFKTHSLMLYTGAVKNLYGLIPGMKKSLYHKEYPRPEDFTAVLRAMYEVARDKIAFNVLDGVLGMEGEGPSGGEPRAFGFLAASQSASALDYAASRMMGFKLSQLAYVQVALHVDGVLPSRIEIAPEWRDFAFENVDTQSVKLRHTLAESAPPFVRALLRRFFDLYPSFTSDCKRCRICVESCPVQALTLDKSGDRPVLDKQACIRCMCCHEMCPHHAVKIEKSWLASRFVKR